MTNETKSMNVDVKHESMIIEQPRTTITTTTLKQNVKNCKKNGLTKKITMKSKNGTSASTVVSLNKSKRVRTIFTPEQLERLENEFEKQQYMVGTGRLYLASTLNLTEAQVKVWFQVIQLINEFFFH